MDVSLTPRQKAAQVVISLGADIASNIYKHLQEDEIEILTYEITRQESVPPEVADQVIDEFYDELMWYFTEFKNRADM